MVWLESVISHASINVTNIQYCPSVLNIALICLLLIRGRGNYYTSVYLPCLLQGREHEWNRCHTFLISDYFGVHARATLHVDGTLLVVDV